MKFKAVINSDGKTEAIFKDGELYIKSAKVGRWNYFSEIKKEWPRFDDLGQKKEIGKHATEQSALNFKGTYSKGSVIVGREVFKVER